MISNLAGYKPTIINNSKSIIQMKRIRLILLFLIISICSWAQSRNEINIPDIPGYLTLKCDFHMHTVFSDGSVWPTIRVTEAWQEGLDAIAITEHIEYRPHSQDIQSDHNRSYEIAKPAADRVGLVLVRAAEITRSMPPGHLNALFIKNANLLEREEAMEAIREAKEQGAFLIWNHPGWKAQQPDETKWFDVHSQLLANGMLHGIEVYNMKEYYPEAVGWAKEKKLTMFANSDIHAPIGMKFDLEKSHRPMTLVFAKEKSTSAIREALFSRRTAAYFGDTIVGAKEYLAPLFNASLEIQNPNFSIRNKQVKNIQVHNYSDVDFVLTTSRPSVGVESKDKVVLKAHRTVSIELRGNSEELRKMRQIKLHYKVNNLLVGDDTPLDVEIVVPNR
ncbi:histidinol-phosphatase [Puteibacter caeruleilacunae]|nr:histidinol-phosphatase [Puteibacter caeruleilacunae]